MNLSREARRDAGTEEPVLLKVSEGIAIVTLNRPGKRNALTRSLLEQLLGVFEAVDHDDRVRVVLLKGNGKAFCGGMDLAEMLAVRQAAWFDYELLHEVLERLASQRNPTICSSSRRGVRRRL